MYEAGPLAMALIRSKYLRGMMWGKASILTARMVGTPHATVKSTYAPRRDARVRHASEGEHSRPAKGLRRSRAHHRSAGARRPRRARGRVHRHRRPVGLREDDAAADPGRTRASDE